MPMELKVSERKAEWDNIKKLYRFQWVQRRNWLTTMAVIAAVGWIGTILERCFWKPVSWDLMIGSGNALGMYAIMILVVLCVYGANILTIPNLTMYPGTVKTRFISRILFDYSLLISGVGCMIAAHLLGMGVIKIMAATGGSVWEHVFFDWKTFLLRITLCFAYFIMIYNLFVLIYCIAVKAGPLNSLIGIGVIMIVGAFLLYKGILLKMLVKLWGFYMEKNIGYTIAMSRVLVTAAVFLLLAYGIVRWIHIWREDMKGIVGFAVVIFYVLSMICSIMMMSGDGDNGTGFFESETGDLLQDIQDGLVITSDRIVHAGKMDGQKMNLNVNNAKDFFDDLDELECTVGWVELDNAKENHLVSGDFQMNQGDVCVRIIADNSKYKDQYMYRGIIDNIQVDVTDGEFKMKLGKKAIVYDKFMTTFDSVLGKDIVKVQWHSMSDDIMSSVLQQCQIYIIYHKEDMVNKDAIQNYFYDTTLPWYGDISE